MTQEHPITPPSELVQQWINEVHHQNYCNTTAYCIAQAARWGADQELDACRLWVSENCDIYSAVELIQFRRPKPPSLQDQALDDLERIAALLMKNNLPCDTGNIRRALEALPD